MTPEITFPTSIKAESLNSWHPDYTDCVKAWEDYEILHCGGHRIEKQPGRFLKKRAKEPKDVYAARCKAFNYTNLVGTITGWYLSKMFRADPEIDIARKDAAGLAIEGSLTTEQKRWSDGWLANCDRAGTSYTDFFRDAFRDLLLYRTAWVMMDLPASDPAEFRNRAEQMAAGALDPYITLWNPANVINWSEDRHGVLEWAVLFSSATERSPVGGAVNVERWTIVTRGIITVYARKWQAGDRDKPEFATQELAPRPHVLADLGKVPVYRFCIPESLHIADRISLNAKAHLNTENALDWALMQGNLAVPVITGGREDTLQKQFQFTEVGAIALPEGCTIGYLEQTGNAYTISAARLEQIREEIYRAAYLMDQGRSTEATPASQSGISKQADKEPANDVLNAFGDKLRVAMQSVLNDVLHVREMRGLTSDVRGFSFNDGDPIGATAVLSEVRSLNIPSDSLDKELMKRVARASLTDANRTLLEKVTSEIDSSPSREDREKAAMEAEQTTLHATAAKFAA